MDKGLSFGAWLKQRRREFDLTQEELARRVGCAAVTVRKIESGEKRPSKQLVELIITELGIPNEQQDEISRFARGGSLPVLSARRNPRHNLPYDSLSSFVGRDRDFNEVQQLLKSGRLVTLTGTGGIGKTRLAIQVGRDLLNEYHDGVWLVDLAPLKSPDLVLSKIATLFGLREETGHLWLEDLKNYLATKNLLLILDNCEHLIAACAELVHSLLQSCPDLRIVTTSREVLNIEGERLWRVSPLAFPRSETPRIEELEPYAAVQLFVERAQMVKPDFHLTPQNTPFVAEISRRLDGIPLAIELASARLSVLSVKEIAARLTDRLDLLTQSRRTAWSRHATLRAALDWSFGLLTDKEQALMRRLSAFAGGWTLEAAIRICATDPIEPGDMLDLLANLASKSMIVVEELEDGTRYRFLETIREFAHEKLVGGEGIERVQARHFQYFFELVTISKSDDELESEHDNWRAALDWALSRNATHEGIQLAISLAGFWSRRSGSTEAILYLNKGLALIPDLADEAQRLRDELNLRTALGSALLANRGYAYAEVEHAYLRAKELAQQIGDVSQLWPVLWGLWNFYEMSGKFFTARELADQLLSLGENSKDRDIQLEAHRALGDLLFWSGDFVQARNHSEQAIQLYDSSRHGAHVALVGEDPGVCALEFSAFAAWHLGLLDESAARMDETLALARQLSHSFSLAQALIVLAMTTQLQGNVAMVKEQAEEVCAIASRDGYPFYYALGTALRGWAMAGIEMIRNGLKAYRELGSAVLSSYLLYLLAMALAKNGQIEDSLNTIAEALSLSEANNERWCQTELYRLRGELFLKQTDPNLGRAEESFRRALKIARAQQASSLELRAAISLSRLLISKGEKEEAHQILTESYNWFHVDVENADLRAAKALLADMMNYRLSNLANLEGQ